MVFLTFHDSTVLSRAVLLLWFVISQVSWQCPLPADMGRIMGAALISYRFWRHSTFRPVLRGSFHHHPTTAERWVEVWAALCDQKPARGEQQEDIWCFSANTRVPPKKDMKKNYAARQRNRVLLCQLQSCIMFVRPCRVHVSVLNLQSSFLVQVFKNIMLFLDCAKVLQKGQIHLERREWQHSSALSKLPAKFPSRNHPSMPSSTTSTTAPHQNGCKKLLQRLRTLTLFHSTQQTKPSGFFFPHP